MFNTNTGLQGKLFTKTALVVYICCTYEFSVYKIKTTVLCFYKSAIYEKVGRILCFYIGEFATESYFSFGCGEHEVNFATVDIDICRCAVARDDFADQFTIFILVIIWLCAQSSSTEKSIITIDVYFNTIAVGIAIVEVGVEVGTFARRIVQGHQRFYIFLCWIVINI